MSDSDNMQPNSTPQPHGGQPTAAPQTSGNQSAQAPQDNNTQPSAAPQTGFRRPDGPRKHSSHRLLWAIGAVVAVLLVVLAVTNPGRDDHKQAIQAEVRNALKPQGDTSADADSDDGLAEAFGFFGDMVSDYIAGPVLDEILEYHNYLFFSRTTVTFHGKATTTSWGVLGHVYTATANDLDLFLNKKSPIFRQDDTHEAAPDAPDEDSSAYDAPAIQDEDGNFDTDGDTLSAAGRRGVEKIVDGVGDIVKDQASQDGDKKVAGAVDKVVAAVKKLISL